VSAFCPVTFCPTFINSIILSGIALKQDTFKFKIVPHKQKSIVN
jgi:hypothetical protein